MQSFITKCDDLITQIVSENVKILTGILSDFSERLGAVHMVPLTRDSMKCEVF
jgi:hypothetical protein